MQPPKIIVKAFVLSLTLAASGSAQVTLKTTGQEFGYSLSDVLHIWTSPVRAQPRDWIAAIGVAAGAVALLPEDDQIDSWIVRHPNAAIVRAVSPFGEDHPELGDLSTDRRLIPISAVLIASGMASDNRKLREAGWGCLSAWQASSSIRALMYATVSRERPSLNNGDQYAIKTPGGNWDYHSFFGGHAANAWACTTFWNSRFHMGLLEPVLYAAAAGITFSRMTDRRHWASDTWIGITAGYAMGRSVAARYARRESKREQKKAAEPIRAALLDGLRLSPASGGGLAIGWSGTFGGPSSR
jgi:PAP2 superfamily protein